MRLIFLVTLLLSGWYGLTQSLEEVRAQFHQAVQDQDNCENFHQFLADKEFNDPVFLAYQATSEALLAQVVWNPFGKFSQVNKYEELMNEAIGMDSTNLEIRFLRLSIEHNLPAFLGMSHHVKKDSRFLKSNIMEVKAMGFDKAFNEYILYFMEETGLCTKEEIIELREAIETE